MKLCIFQKKQSGQAALLFFSVMLFKFACDLGYAVILSRDTATYTYDVDGFRYLNGLAWCTILFWGIRHGKRQASVFMLCLVYLMQIIPITTVYALGNKSAVYYNTVCMAFLLCEILVQWIHIRDIPYLQKSPVISFLMMAVMAGALAGLAIYIVRKNGMFTLTALNIYKVYELRSSGSFIIGKYTGYLFTWMLAAIIPFFLAKKINDKNYMAAFILCGIVWIAYLYSGHKGYLFSLPVIFVSSLWAGRKNFYHEVFICACVVFFILVILACYSPIFQRLFEEIYSLLGRRQMMVSANNKFTYYDFFSKNPKMGLSGIFPRWLFPIPTPYADIRYTFLISELYYGKPEMNSNTGFLAEGYMRFGHIGTFLILILFAVLLKMMDRMQRNEGYPLTIGAFIYPVLSLSDVHLIDTLFFGTWMMILIFLLFYTHYPGIKTERNRYE